MSGFTSRVSHNRARGIAAAVAALLLATVSACGQNQGDVTGPSAVSSNLAAGNPNVTLPKPVISNTGTCGQALLSWTNTPVSAKVANRWHVQVSDTADFSNILFNDAQYGTTSLLQILAPGTYWIRVDAMSTEAHVNNSGFTVLQFTVVACNAGCTFSQGYWKTHPDPWPVAGLTLGSVAYAKTDLLSIFTTPPAGNGLISLAHQLIAAKLNIANGADASAIAGSLSSADALIGALVIPPVGGGSLTNAATSALVSALTAYNEGTTGPGHCAGDVSGN